MPTIITCPNPSCSRRLAVPDGQPRSRLMRCPHCQVRISAQTTDGQASVRTLGAALDPSPNDANLRQIGRFEVRERLGAGAFCGVYLAFDPQLDRAVALKVPHPGLALKVPYRAPSTDLAASNASCARPPSSSPAEYLLEGGKPASGFHIRSFLRYSLSCPADVQ
jgi:hypothetical protein